MHSACASFRVRLHAPTLCSDWQLAGHYHAASRHVLGLSCRQIVVLLLLLYVYRSPSAQACACLTCGSLARVRCIQYLALVGRGKLSGGAQIGRSHCTPQVTDRLHSSRCLRFAKQVGVCKHVQGAPLVVLRATPASMVVLWVVLQVCYTRLSKVFCM